jgi:hypothetical protein
MEQLQRGGHHDHIPQTPETDHDRLQGSCLTGMWACWRLYGYGLIPGFEVSLANDPLRGNTRWEHAIGLGRGLRRIIQASAAASNPVLEIVAARFRFKRGKLQP